MCVNRNYLLTSQNQQFVQYFLKIKAKNIFYKKYNSIVFRKLSEESKIKKKKNVKYETFLSYIIIRLNTF